MFCWGDTSKGQLGVLGAAGRVSAPTFVHLFPEPVVSVACGEHHTLFLALSGRVMSCGRNSKGQLGRAKSKDTKFPVIEGLGGVEAVACGQEHSLALCESGQVFSWGGGEEGQLGVISSVAKCTKPELIQIPSPLPIPVVQVACGHFHSLALTKGGEVFAWGQNKYGQLGLGKAITMQATPALVRALTGVPVTRVAAGGAHTLALALPARVFCCGANSAGQLGLKRTDEKGRFSVCAVPALRNMAITSISCGAEHTAVLTKAGEVYTFGDGAHGQLGHNSTDKELLPRKVKGIDAPAKEVTCGSHHTLVLTASGILLAFGRGVKGQMENGCTEDGLQPIKLEGSWNKLAAAKHAEIKISSGWSSNFLFFPPPKTSVLGESIGKLDQAQVQTWLSLSEKDFNLEEAKREICLNFSTSSNLVACFMKDCGASSGRVPGMIQVDLNAASQTFDKLLIVPWIKKAMNIIPLVHNLLYAAPFMRCPEVFLLLPTCPILHEDHNAINLVLPLAVAITNLNESATKTLQEHWCSMEAPMMTKHICMWKQALAFLLKSMVWLNYTPGVNAVLEVLKCLYKANKKAQHQRKVAFSEFYIEEIGNTPLLLQKDVTLWRQINWGLVQEVEGTCVLFCRYPFLLDLQSKINVFNYVADITKVMHQVIHESVRDGGFPQYTLTGETPTPVLQLKLRRTALLEDTFRQLSSTDHYNFRKELLVQFAEDSKLTDVNKRDFFLHAFTELVDPDSRMFIYNDTQTLVWFPAKPNIESKRYFLLGILCGMALYNGTIVHMPFPLAMFKKLVNAKANLEDLMEFSPVLGERLRDLLHDYTNDDAEKMELTFHVSWDGADVELVPQGKEKLVTSANKKEFVNAYVDYILNKSVEKVFEEFQRGFYKVCDRDVVGFFQPEELRGVLVGSEDYDWDTFKKNTVYSGMFHEKHPTIVTFWEVFEELTDKQKKAFLLFLTGCDRVPIQGMVHVRMTVSPLLNSTQDHLPESLTCHSILMLPPYETRLQQETKLAMALNHNRGFWKE
ncbi:probable E3 ubiquitin-protein ligase HERC6 [Electrophorus electricus]|uniref:HECT domain-containing protein n=1 Tax=Electrophorus electricus TaxID=8005 RepID=A0A4W4FYB5_ELEEL|nr:probable E3 ubiquitin-protein ligase HERC6 [Electrophorus electricus]